MNRFANRFRFVLAGLCLVALITLVLGCISNVLSDGGDIANGFTWVAGYCGVFGQLGFTDKELGGLGPFAILALLCTTVLVYKIPTTPCCKP